ncbi:MAG: TetR/AcrR family transcriptional regulator [Acidimicrobiales bacterium]
MGRAEDNKRDKLERILRAARILFARNGYAGTTVDDIASRAGVSKGAVYFHVGSKAALVNRVFHDDFSAWIDQAFMATDNDDHHDIIEALVTVYARLLQLMCSAPELTRQYMTTAGAGAGREQVQEAMDNLLGRTADRLEEAKRRRVLEATVDSRQLAYNLWALYFVEQHRWLLDHPDGDTSRPAADIRARLRPPFTTQLGGYLRGPADTHRT